MCDYGQFVIIYKRKAVFLLLREFDHILNIQKYVSRNFVSIFYNKKIDIEGFNLALFIFCLQLLRHFSEKKKYKAGILANFYLAIIGKVLKIWCGGRVTF